MGLLDFLLRLLGSGGHSESPISPTASFRADHRKKERGTVTLQPLRYQSDRTIHDVPPLESVEPPYRFARPNATFDKFVDLTTDERSERLARYSLPTFRTPDQLAEWLQISVGQLAWLGHRFHDRQRAGQQRDSHYHYQWLKKRRGGFRLIEAPKTKLRNVQSDILSEILEKVPAHSSAHGFVPGRSIVTNASPHVGQHVVLKFDLDNFYARVRFNRVVALFRGIGYCREMAIWLARLTTTAIPTNLPFPEGDPTALNPYWSRHLAQGAPTSPAIANLVAYSLDIRLSGLARSFGAEYTRYADDLTFSGSRGFARSLSTFIPLVTQIVRDESFRVNRKKRKVVRQSQRQVVTGVVVNDRVNVSRKDFDQLKAILHNCRRLGPASQNRENHDDFAAHLRGRIAHVAHLNPQRGEKLLRLYNQIRWSQ